MFSWNTKSWDFRESLCCSFQVLNSCKDDRLWQTILWNSFELVDEEMGWRYKIQVFIAAPSFAAIVDKILFLQTFNGKLNKTQPKHPERYRKKVLMNNSIYLQASWCCIYDSDIILWARDLASACVLVPCPPFATSPSLPLAVIPGLRLVPRS